MFKVTITCDDCTGSDPKGCNDGQPWELEDSPFETLEEAENAGWEAVEDTGPYQFEIRDMEKHYVVFRSS